MLHGRSEKKKLSRNRDKTTDDVALQPSQTQNHRKLH